MMPGTEDMKAEALLKSYLVLLKYIVDFWSNGFIHMPKYFAAF